MNKILECFLYFFALLFSLKFIIDFILVNLSKIYPDKIKFKKNIKILAVNISAFIAIILWVVIIVFK
jgi:hypothetical protein